MKTIVFLSATLYRSFFSARAKTFGGVSRIYRLVRRLALSEKHHIVCFTGDFGQPPYIIKEGVSLVKSNIDRSFRVISVYRDLLRHPSDIVVDFYASPRILLLAILKKFHRRKFIFFTGSDMDVNGEYLNLSNRFFYFCYVTGLRHADRIICQTEAQALSLKKTYHLHGEVVLSPYLDITPPRHGNREFILWAGRSIFYKGPLHFLDLARAIPDAHFVMISNPSDDPRFHEKLKKEAQAISNLRFIEAVPFEEMPEYFAQATFLVNTSDFEGVPNTFIEAAMEETPILSLNVDPNQMLSAHGAGICAMGSFQVLVKEAKRLIHDPERLDRLGKAARRYAVSNHDMDKAIQKIEAIFEDVMKR